MNKNDLFRKLASNISIKNCPHCKASINDAMCKLEEEKPFKLTFNPDINCHGIVTHWHIDLIQEK